MMILQWTCNYSEVKEKNKMNKGLSLYGVKNVTYMGPLNCDNNRYLLTN